MKTTTAKRVFFLGVALVLAGCDNMQHQPGAQASTRGEPVPPPPAPAGTVSRAAPAPGDPVATGFRDGQPLDHSPVPFTRELVREGRGRFDIYCLPCHGEDGYGQGIVVRRGFPPPPSYHIDRLRTAPDGHFFDVMTRGYGVMLPYADRLTPHERWAVVAYIRALQLSQHATVAGLPPADRAHFSSP